jgi:phosphotransferase system HPr (HPr) family protein
MAPISSTSSKCKPAQGTYPGITETFTLRNLHGLHARPAAFLLWTLLKFDCTVSVECGGHCVNGRSILGLMSLAAGYGSRLTFRAEGREATRALAAVKELFGTNFEGAYRRQQPALPAEPTAGRIERPPKDESEHETDDGLASETARIRSAGA